MREREEHSLVLGLLAGEDGAVVMHPVGGWLADRIGPARVLAAGLTVILAGAAIQAFTPPLVPLGAIAFLAMAAALALAATAVRAALTARAAGTVALTGK